MNKKVTFDQAKTVVSLWIQEHPDTAMWIGVGLLVIVFLF